MEVFDNDIHDNQTSSVSIVSYLVSGKKIKDKQFDAIPEGISIHHNRISGGGKNPQGNIKELLSPVLGHQFPDILFDGVVNSSRAIDGKIPHEFGHAIHDNGPVSFVNFKLTELNPANVAAGNYQPDTNLAALSVKLPALKPVQLREHDPPNAANNANVIAFRKAPRKLSEYGLFAGHGASQTPAQGVMSYELNTALFSDYATKRRFIHIPQGSKIEYRESGVFEFPVGTVIAKTFSYYHDERNPAQGEQLLETRIETRLADGWHGYSYAWNEQQTEAVLLLGGGTRKVSWMDRQGRKRTVDYQIPNANQCLNCHSQDKQFVPLGPVAANMNRPFRFGDRDQNQLEHLDELGWLANKPAPEEIPRWPHSHAETEPLDARARAWLHVNCAHCHSPLGTARTSGLDLRWQQRDPLKFGVWKAPVAAGHGTGGRGYDIVPGKPDESILLHRLESKDPSVMMPNVAKRLVPTEAVDLIRAWIQSLPAE